MDEKESLTQEVDPGNIKINKNTPPLPLHIYKHSHLPKNNFFLKIRNTKKNQS